MTSCDVPKGLNKKAGGDRRILLLYDEMLLLTVYGIGEETPYDVGYNHADHHGQFHRHRGDISEGRGDGLSKVHGAATQGQAEPNPVERPA